MSVADFIDDTPPAFTNYCPGLVNSKFSADVDKRLSTTQSKSVLPRDEKQTYFNNLIKSKKLIPAPNQYHLRSGKPQEKTIYPFDRTTYFSEVENLAKKSLTGPFSYDPNPLQYRPGSAKIKCHLHVSSQRVSVPDEAAFLSK